MTLQKKTEHVQEGLDLLLHQFKGKEKMEALLASYLSDVQQVEDALFGLITDRTIETAEGHQLDLLGTIVGESREGRTDDDYRLGVKARIRLNLSTGTTEDIIGLVRALAGNVRVQVTESDYPAHFQVNVLDPLDIDGYHVARFIQSGKPVGVRGLFLWHPEHPFGFDKDPEAYGFYNLDDPDNITDVGHFGGAAEGV